MVARRRVSVAQGMRAGRPLAALVVALDLLAVVAEGYVAGAVQHYPFLMDYRHQPQEIIAANLDAFDNYTRAARGAGVDILVFPESGLGWLWAELNNTRTSMAPFCEVVPPVGTVPCGGTAGLQTQRLSCMAAKNGIAIVANMCEWESCNASVAGERAPHTVWPLPWQPSIIPVAESTPQGAP